MAERTDDGHGIGLARRAGSAMAWGQTGKLIEVAFTVVTAVIVVRALEPHSFGTYALLTNLAGVASVFIPVAGTEALGAVLPRFADRRRRIWLVGLVAVLRLGIILATIAVVVPLWNTLAGSIGVDFVSIRVLLVGALYWVAQDILNTTAGLYLSELDLRPVAFWRSVGQSLTLVGVVAAIAADAATVGLVLFIVATGYAVAAVGLAAAAIRSGAVRPPIPDVRFVLSFTRHVWLIGVVSLALATQVDVLLIGGLTEDPQEVAYYVAAVGVIGRAQLLFMTGWSSIIIPALGATKLSRGRVGVAARAKSFAELWLLVMLPLNVLIAVLANDIVVTLFGADYARAGELLAVFATFNVVATLAAGPAALGALWAFDLQKLVARVRIVVAALNIGLAVLLIPEYGAMGAVVATGIAAVLSAAVDIVLAQRAHVLVFPARMAATVIVAAAAAAGAAWLAPGGSAGLVAGLVLGTAAYLTVLTVIRPFRPEHLALLAGVSPRLARSKLRLLVRS